MNRGISGPEEPTNAGDTIASSIIFKTWCLQGNHSRSLSFLWSIYTHALFLRLALNAVVSKHMPFTLSDTFQSGMIWYTASAVSLSVLRTIFGTSTSCHYQRFRQAIYQQSHSLLCFLVVFHPIEWFKACPLKILFFFFWLIFFLDFCLALRIDE